MSDRDLTVNVFRETCIFYLGTILLFGISFVCYTYVGMNEIFGLNLYEALMSAFLFVGLSFCLTGKTVITTIDLIHENKRRDPLHIVQDRIKVFKRWLNLQFLFIALCFLAPLMMIIFCEQLILTLTRFMSHN